MKADIDFNNGTITLVCSKCRRKYVKQIDETKSGLNIKCQCNGVISWGGRSDLGTVLCATIRRYDHAAKRVRLDAIAFATLRGESSDIEHFSFS